MLVEATLPVVLMLDKYIPAFKVQRPTLKAAYDIGLDATRIACARRRVDQATAAMRTYIVKSAQRVGGGSHDDHRIAADIVGDVVANLANIFDPAHLQPGLALKLFLLGAGIVRRRIGFDADRHGLFDVYPSR